MIILFQIIVILVALGIIVVVLGGKQTNAARAWKKITLCLLALGMSIAVIFPETTNNLAHLIGVGRGADLLLYVLTVAFIGYAVNSYLHRQRDEHVVHKLARRIALNEAQILYAKDLKK